MLGGTGDWVLTLDVEGEEPRKDREILYASVEPGSVLVTNAHIVHGGSANISGRRRRVVHGFYTRRGQPQQLNQKEKLSPEVQARVSSLTRKVLALDD